MNYQSPYDNFIFEGYSFDEGSLTATFNYSFDGKLTFQEQVIFSTSETNFNREVLDAALQLAFYLTGTSYYKTFPTKTVLFNAAAPNRHQAEFLNEVYTQGLSQFIFENIYATYRGDRRAADDAYNLFFDKKAVPFPSNEQMIYDTGEDLKQKLKSHLASICFVSSD